MMLPVLCFLMLSKQHYIQDLKTSHEYMISEVGYSKFLVQNEDTIKVTSNKDNNYTLFYGNIDKQTILNHVNIDGNDVNFSTPDFFEADSLVINIHHNATLKFKSYDNKASSIDIWFIPSSLCPNYYSYTYLSSVYYLEFSSEITVSTNCFFVLDYTKNKLDINFGYKMKTDKFANLYTNNFETPALSLSDYNENNKYQYNVPFFIQYELIKGNKFIFSAKTDGSTCACNDMAPNICTSNGCVFGKSFKTSSNCNTHYSKIDNNIEISKIGIAIFVIVVVAIVVGVTIYCIKKKKAKKNRDTVNNNLLNSSSL